MELEEKYMKPEELIDDLEKRACHQRGLVIMTIGQWEAITEAYASPMVKRIAESRLTIYPVREVKTKELSFQVNYGN